MASGMTRDLSRPKAKREIEGREEKPQIELRPIRSEDEKALIGRGRERKEKKANNKTIFRESPPDTRCLLSFRSSPETKREERRKWGKFSGEKEQVGQRPSYKKEGCEFFCGRNCGTIRETARGRPFPSKA